MFSEFRKFPEAEGWALDYLEVWTQPLCPHGHHPTPSCPGMVMVQIRKRFPRANWFIRAPGGV